MEIFLSENPIYREIKGLDFADSSEAEFLKNINPIHVQLWLYFNRHTEQPDVSLTEVRNYLDFLESNLYSDDEYLLVLLKIPDLQHPKLDKIRTEFSHFDPNHFHLQSPNFTLYLCQTPTLYFKVFRMSVRPEDDFNLLVLTRHPEILRYLIETYSQIDIHFNNDQLIRVNAQYGNLECLKYLINRGANYRVDDDTLFRISIRRGYLDVIQYLLTLGSYNLEDAIFESASRGHLEAVKLLHQHGANLHFDSDRAFRYAASRGHLEIVKYLICQGSDIHACNNEAFFYSIRNGHLEILKYLLHLDPTLLNLPIVDKTPLEFARYLNQQEIVRYLETL